MINEDEKMSHTLCNKKQFFESAQELLAQSAENVRWFMIAIDIEKLKLFNEWYSQENGDMLLFDISDYLNKLQDRQGGITGYFGNDDFALLVHCEEKEIEQYYHDIAALIKAHSDKMQVLPALGVYEISDRSLPVFKAYDRANLACAAVKGNYSVRIKKFDNKMMEKLESEYLLLSDIQKAFENEEFFFVLQPKCEMKSGKVVGAEALARWNSKEKGMISPAVFIPFLEKSGFIAALDTYIWEEVCKWQRHMIDKGGPVIPVSVNVSRNDLYSVDVSSYFCGLIEKYDLSPGLIQIEITERAYAEDEGLVSQAVEELRKVGFHVLMDDFGSAYSSLNMLKDISVDTIKIDMRFLGLNGKNKSKGITILETVCNMANILGVGIVVEGVETEEQKNFLLTMKCSCGQGFYFYRPLAVQDFENIMENDSNMGDKEANSEKIERLYLKDLLGRDVFSEIMIDNMLGAVVFYDVYQGEINILRYNERYAFMLGSKNFFSETKLRFGREFYQEDHDKIFRMFEEAKSNRHEGAEIDVRTRKMDGTDVWLNLRTFFLHKQDEHDIFYSSVSDVTKIHKSNEVLRFLNNDMPGGYYRHKNNEDCDFIHISQRFLDISGFTREEIKEEFDDKFINMIHPEDRKKVRQSIAAMEKNGGNYSQPCRIRSKSGYLRVVNQRRLVHYENMEFFQGIILYDLDHYKLLEADFDYMYENNVIMSSVPCGIFYAEVDDNHALRYISSSMLSMLGYSKEEFLEKFENSTEKLVYKEDVKRIKKEIYRQMQHSNYTSSEYRIELADGSLKWFYSRGRLITDENGKRWFSVCIMDYEYLKQKYHLEI